MNGKSKCKTLKEIRSRIARQNDIDYVPPECKFQGSCTGTCPKCEAEVRYLEQELARRKQAGKAVAVAGIAAALLVSATACRPSADRPDPSEDTSVMELQGDVAEYITEETTAGVPAEPLMGEPVLPETMGRIPGE